MVESMSKARMKGRINGLVDQRVAGFQDQVAQEHFFRRNECNPTTHLACLFVASCYLFARCNSYLLVVTTKNEVYEPKERAGGLSSEEWIEWVRYRWWLSRASTRRCIRCICFCCPLSKKNLLSKGGSIRINRIQSVGPLSTFSAESRKWRSERRDCTRNNRSCCASDSFLRIKLTLMDGSIIRFPYSYRFSSSLQKKLVRGGRHIRFTG